MEKNVVLKKDFRGLKAGVEFVFDAKDGLWKFETSGEEITDNSYKSHSSSVAFSDGYVRSKPDVFDVPGLKEKEEAEKKQKIKDLKSLVDSTLEEISKLENE